MVQGVWSVWPLRLSAVISPAPALVNREPILLADEPTCNLDSRAQLVAIALSFEGVSRLR